MSMTFPLRRSILSPHLLEERWCCVSCDAYGGQASTIFSGSRR
jgi:hypothetical protein